MSRSRRDRIGFALFVLALLLIIGRNVYRRYQEKVLTDAVRIGDDDTAAALLKQGIFAHNPRQLEWLLNDAIQNKEPKTVRALLRQNVNLNRFDNSTPLLIAAAANLPDVVSLLLDKGANINAHGGYADQTALSAAISVHHLDCARLLLARGADVNLRGRQSPTPLWIATKRNDKEAVILLLAHGARMEADLPAETALNAAMRLHDSALLFLLLSAHPGQPVKCKALSGAVAAGNAEMVRLLLIAGARPSSQSQEWLTTLHNARKQSVAGKPGYAEALALLRPLGVLATPTKAEMEVRNATGQTELLAALSQGNMEEAQHLLAQGANVNVADRQGQTPLLEAIQHVPSLVAPLLNKGANPNCFSFAGMTPLRQAVQSNDVAIVRLLLEHGADPNLHRADLPTALSRARKHHQADIVTLLQHAGAKE